MESKKEESGSLYELENFREDLAFVTLEIEKHLTHQREKVAKARELDPILRRLSKQAINYLNAGRDEEAERTYQELLAVVADMFAIRGLARQSYLRFRALKEVIEALLYKQVRRYIYEGGEEPAISSIRKLDFTVNYASKKTGQLEKNIKKIFSEEEMDISMIEAMAETCGEISKGLNFDMAMADWQTNPELQDKYLAVGRRALNISGRIISECDDLAAKYSELFDKFFRFLLVRMGDTMEHVKTRISTIQGAIAARQK